MTLELHDLLQRCEYFREIPTDYIDRIVPLWRTVTLCRGEHLFLEGEKGHAIYLLASGCIQLVKTSSDGNQAVIAVIMPGELFAEAVLFERDDYPVSALAVKRSKLYEMDRIDFLHFLNNSQFRIAFLGGLMRRLRYLTNRILELAVYDAEEKFFAFLDCRYGPLKEYNLTMTKKDIARVLGITPETFSRLIKRLEQEGKISWRGNILKVYGKQLVKNKLKHNLKD